MWKPYEEKLGRWIKPGDSISLLLACLPILKFERMMRYEAFQARMGFLQMSGLCKASLVIWWWLILYICRSFSKRLAREVTFYLWQLFLWGWWLCEIGAVLGFWHSFAWLWLPLLHSRSIAKPPWFWHSALRLSHLQVLVSAWSACKWISLTLNLFSSNVAVLLAKSIVDQYGQS